MLAVAVPLGAQTEQNSGMRSAPSSFDSVRPVVICFPPTPPPLDRAISHAVPQMPPRFTPPAELAAYINEPFYAPLSTWLLEKTLTAKMRARIETLRGAKAQALGELRIALEQALATEPTARRGALQTLARRQTPQLAALEREAEQIRAELATSNYDWRALREWALGDRSRRGDSPMEIAATMRAYAYYQSGLADGQRRLLREIAVELASAGEDTTAATAAQPFLFFSPEPVRVLLPEDLPADLAAKVADYQTKKSTLKTELYDTIYKGDDTALGFLRNNAVKSLAERQAPRLDELEQVADEIRRGLAELPSATRPSSDRSTLPPVLTARLDAMVRAGALVQKEALQRIDAIRAAIADEPIQLSYSFDSSGLKYSVVPRVGRGGPPAAAKAQLEKLQPRMQEINSAMSAISEDFGQRMVALVNEADAIRADAAIALGNADARTVEAALVTARRISAVKESEEGYREYRLAVFEPGLSPEQRRLLLGGAIEKLDVPLPRGEYQPMRRSAGW